MTALRCYMCGKQLPKRFSLITMAEGSADRVFIAHDKCARQADSATIIRVRIITSSLLPRGT